MPPPNSNKPGRRNIVRDNLLQKINEVVIGGRSSGDVTSRKTVIYIVDKVLKANDPNTLSEFCGTITSTDNWAGCISQSMNWVQRNRTTGNKKPAAHLLVPEKN